MTRLLDRSLGVLAGLLLLALVAVTGIDVVGRYLLGAPLQGAFELTEVLLAGLVFAALPLTTRAGEHVEVDLFAGLMPGGIARLLGRLGAGLAALALAVIAWQLALHAMRLAADGSVTSSLRLPLSLVAGFAAFASGLSAIIAGLQVATGAASDEPATGLRDEAAGRS